MALWLMLVYMLYGSIFLFLQIEALALLDLENIRHYHARADDGAEPDYQGPANYTDWSYSKYERWIFLCILTPSSTVLSHAKISQPVPAEHTLGGYDQIRPVRRDSFP
ncbi:MAG: hypothetical protein LAT67_12240 [Balneolales bacterium]|nr:hypothetical protein [Balneolales bacterium]